MCFLTTINLTFKFQLMVHEKLSWRNCKCPVDLWQPGQIVLKKFHPSKNPDISKFSGCQPFREMKQIASGNGWHTTGGIYHTNTLSIHMITSRDFVYARSQWETTLQCNVVSHWLSAHTERSLHVTRVSHAHSNYRSDTPPTDGCKLLW